MNLAMSGVWLPQGPHIVLVLGQDAADAQHKGICTIVHMLYVGQDARFSPDTEIAIMATVPAAARSSAADKLFHGRLKVDATFCPEDVADPFDTCEWEVRTSAIKGENGEGLFEQDNCEVPSFWSQLATNVICSKYFYGEIGTDEREYSVRQLVHRVSRTIADWGLEDGYFASAADAERFYRDNHDRFNPPIRRQRKLIYADTEEDAAKMEKLLSDKHVHL